MYGFNSIFKLWLLCLTKKRKPLFKPSNQVLYIIRLCVNTPHPPPIFAHSLLGAMGNAFGGKKRVKVMKVTGETMKLNTPVQAGDVVKDYPGFVVLDSEAVKHYGVRAKPLEPHQNLSRKRLYFLVDLPKLPNQPVIKLQT